jgi:hypothetical protein
MTAPNTDPETWIVAEHKALSDCIQYLGKQKWAGWTTPELKPGDILVSRMGRFVVSKVEPGDEPGMVLATSTAEVPTTTGGGHA